MTVAPASSPTTPFAQGIMPTTMGVTTAMTVAVPFLQAGLVHSDPRTARGRDQPSSISPVSHGTGGVPPDHRLWAARPTEFMVSAANTKGRHAPINRPTSTTGFIRRSLERHIRAPTSFTFSI